MKFRRRSWQAVSLLLILASLAQWWLVQFAHKEMERLTQRLVPQGELRYERLWPFLWGGAMFWGVTFQPEGMLRMNLQTPPGFRLRIDRLYVGNVRHNADGLIEHVSGHLHGAEIPIEQASSTSAPRALGVSQALPAWRDLGLASLRFDLDFDADYLASANLALVDIEAVGAGLGRLLINTQLEGAPQDFSRTQDLILVREVTMRFADGGLLQRYKEVAIARSGLRETTWEHAVREHLQQRSQAEHWNWDADSRLALDQLIDRPTSFRAFIDPPGDVPLRNIRLYKLREWAPALGFRLAAPVTP